MFCSRSLSESSRKWGINLKWYLYTWKEKVNPHRQLHKQINYTVFTLLQQVIIDSANSKKESFYQEILNIAKLYFSFAVFFFYIFTASIFLPKPLIFNKYLVRSMLFFSPSNLSKFINIRLSSYCLQYQQFFIFKHATCCIQKNLTDKQLFIDACQFYLIISSHLLVMLYMTLKHTQFNYFEKIMLFSTIDWWMFTHPPCSDNNLFPQDIEKLWSTAMEKAQVLNRGQYIQFINIKCKFGNKWPIVGQFQ